MKRASQSGRPDEVPLPNTGPVQDTGLIQSCLWRRLQGEGLERFELAREADGWQLRGTILAGGEGGPFELRYAVSCDPAWHTRRAALTLRSGGTQKALTLTSEAGVWRVGGREIEAVRGAIDVDLSWSPSTNTLPIRRVPLAAGGSSGRIVAAWVRLPQLTIEPLEQEYRRLSEARYQYTSRGGSFTAGLEVDAHGVVVDYEGIWRRV